MAIVMLFSVKDLHNSKKCSNFAANMYVRVRTHLLHTRI